jgi:TRAP-type uncharacterized transport system substrate-binding protein
MTAAVESDAILHRVLEFLQRDRRIRVGLGLLLVAAMLVIAGRSAYRLVPRHYTLTITGGDIVSNRHFLARIIQSEASKHGLTLIVEPVSTGLDTLERVSQGKLDLAFIQGGIEQQYPNVEHVATVMPELVHLLVKPGVHGMDDLKGRSINMGIKNSPSRSIALTLLRFAGYAENIDYVETNFTAEQLLGLPLRKMPDAIITVSSVPSYLVEILVRKHHYQVMEIPFPESLALRHGWAANGVILPYTYDLAPPVPEKNTQTVAVNMHLVANSKANPAAVAKLLEVMYSPSVEHRLLQPVDEKRIMIPSGFPISEGLNEYLHRNDSVFTVEMWNKAQGVFGILMSFAGTLLVMLKWFKGKPIKIAYDDGKFLTTLDEVLAIERKSLAMETASAIDRNELKAMHLRLSQLRLELIEKYPKAVLKDPQIFDRCMTTVRVSQERVLSLWGMARKPA